MKDGGKGVHLTNTRRWKEHLWMRINEWVAPNFAQTPDIYQNPDREKFFVRAGLSKWAVPLDDTNTMILSWRHFNDELDLEDEHWARSPGTLEKYTLSDHLWGYLKDYAAKHRANGNGFGFGLVDEASPTRTLSARYHKDGSEILVPLDDQRPLPRRVRRLTPRECARLQGFPDTFNIVCSDTQAYRQFGNSVAVPVIERLARQMLLDLASVATESHSSAAA